MGNLQRQLKPVKTNKANLSVVNNTLFELQFIDSKLNRRVILSNFVIEKRIFKKKVLNRLNEVLMVALHLPLAIRMTWSSLQPVKA